MGYRGARPGYTVSVEGLLLAGSHFVIHAAIDYDPLLRYEERELLAPQAQLEALLAIEGQEARARRLGVSDVHVGVVGDDGLRRFFRGGMHPPAPPSRVTARGKGRGVASALSA